jgi:hypothetical protein
MGVSFVVWNIIFGIIGNLMTLGLIWLVTKVPSSLSRRDPRRSSRLLPWLIGFLPLLNIGFFLFIVLTTQSVWWLVAIPISFSALMGLLWQELNAFWGVGIRGVDREITKGIDYGNSLKLVQNKLKFMGIGASKLSRLEDEFENALVRCKKEDPIKLLLCKPNDEKLTLAAKRFNKPENQYRDNTVALRWSPKTGQVVKIEFCS